MKNLIVILFFSVLAFGQKEQFVSNSPHEIFKFKQTFELKDATVIDYAIVENDKKLVVVGKSSIQTFDATNGKLESYVSHEITKNHQMMFRSAISPNGNYLLFFDYIYSERMPILVKSKKLAAVLYDLKTGKLVKVLEGGVNSIGDAFFSKNEKTLATQTEFDRKNQENEFCFLDGETLKYRNCVSVFGGVGDLQMSSDGALFFAGVSKEQKYGGIDLGSLRWFGVWDTQNGKLIKSFKLDEQTYLFDRLLLTTNEKSLAVGGMIFESFRNSLPKILGKNRIRGVSSNGEKLFLSEKKGLQIYDIETDKISSSIPQIKDDYAINLAATERVLINQNLRRNCGRTEAFEIETGKKLWELKLACYYQSSDCLFCSDKPNFNDSIEFLNSGEYFVTSSKKAIRIWDTMKGELLQVLDSPEKYIGKKDSKFDDRLKGEKLIWSADRKSVFVQSDDSKMVHKFENQK